MLIIITPRVAVADNLDEKIRDLEARIKTNQAAAGQKHGEAETLKQKIASLDAEISTAQSALDLTNLQANKTNLEISVANNDLKRQQDILRENIRMIYKSGEVSPIELVASSKSLSDFVAQNQYLGAIKRKVDDNVNKIDALKKELDVKKAELNILAGKQQAQVKGIADKRVTQANFLAATQGEEANYQSEVRKLEESKKNVAAEIASRVASFAQSGQYTNLGTVNQGDIIGYMGSTGNSSGTHLHFTVFNSNGAHVNPVGSPFGYQGVTNGIVTQDYGPADGSFGYSFHNGIDIANPSSPPIRAAASGTIVLRASGFNGGWGNYVVILHGNGYSTLYAHMLPF